MANPILAITNLPNGTCDITTENSSANDMIRGAIAASNWPISVTCKSDNLLSVSYADGHPIFRICVCTLLEQGGLEVPKTWIELHAGGPSLTVKSQGNLTLFSAGRPIGNAYRVFDCPSGICASGATTGSKTDGKLEVLDREHVLKRMVSRGCIRQDVESCLIWLDSAEA